MEAFNNFNFAFWNPDLLPPSDEQMADYWAKLWSWVYLARFNNYLRNRYYKHVR